jgi:rubrerythrin
LKKGAALITQAFNPIDEFDSFTVLGDPGCDGLGSEIVSVFTEGLRESKGDFQLIVGDIVPFGSKLFYANMAELINAVTDKTAFAVCGNHDTGFYNDYFGLKDYCLADSRTLIIAIDNSMRVISEQSLEFLSGALEQYRRPNIILTMHIPPPNRVSPNAISQAEWEKILFILAPCRDQLKYIICGHLHSYFEDSLDGTKLVVSGGAGARIENVEGIPAPYNHIVEFFYDTEGNLSHKKIDIHPAQESGQFPGDPKIKKMLTDAFAGECMAHVRYKLYAEDAQKRGLKNAAKLFAAASDSEWYHAKNFYTVMGGLQEPDKAARESAENERHEVDELYRDCSEYARDKKLGLPAYAFSDALLAEKVHLRLFENAIETLKTGKDIAEESYFTCSSCGYTFAGAEHPKNCPVCGAPADKILPVV